MFAHGDSPGELTRLANERNRVAREIRLLCSQKALPSGSSRSRKRICKQLRRLTQLLDSLDVTIAELRMCEVDIYHGPPPSGSPASSSRPHPAGSTASSSHLHPAGSPASSSRPHPSGSTASSSHPHPSGSLASSSRPHPAGSPASSSHLHPAGSPASSSRPHPSGSTASSSHPHPAGSPASYSRPHPSGSPASSSHPHPAGSPASSSRPHPSGSTASSSRETGVVRHVDTIDSDILDSTIGEPSALEEKKPSEIPGKYWRPKFVGTVIFERRQAEREFAERQAQSLQARGQRTYASKDEIVRNAKKWMSEEVMVAFRRFIESEDDLKDIEYEFEKLLHQCFNVEHHFKICHHFNFSVKIKKCVSDDWTQMTFFAEVISILQKKHYVCSPLPLDPNEDGECYACRNQGMHELRHPSADIFDCGNEDTTFPYYEDSDSDEAHPAVGGSESDDDMS